VKNRLFFLALLILGAGTAACLPAARTSTPPTSSPAQSASATPTATIDWFPATATATLRPTEVIQPTATAALALGAELLRDDFSSPGEWEVIRNTTGSSQYGKNRFTLAVSAKEGYLLSLRSTPEFKDFYLEITASPSLCRDSDSYGVYLRSGGEGYGYRWVITCDGRTRLERVRDFHASLVEDWVGSPFLTPGSPVTLHLGAWMSGPEMRFYVEGVEVFRTREPLYAGGQIGLFARASGDTPVTVSFSDLKVFSIDSAALPTRTPFPQAVPTQ
jgi:hypothetical protein